MSTPGGLDFPDGFEQWPRSVQERWLADYHALYFPKLRWWDRAETLEEDSGPRPSQLPPDHPRHAEPDLQGNTCGCGGNPDWSTWLLLTGRGWGKTKTGSNWVIEMALSRPGIYIGVCAPTDKAVRSICLEGESGVELEARRYGVEIADYNKNRLEMTFANGSKVRGFSAEKPDSIRGENLSYAWFDELAMIRYFQFFHEGLQPALRKGDNPRLLITTTPKRVRLLRELLADGENEAVTGVHVTRGRTAENIHYAKRQREALERKYAGTSMLRQELEGESGVIAVARKYGVEITDYNKNRLEITFANDSKIRGFSAEKPDSIRGENLSYAWFDELAMIRYFQFYHEGLQPALRKGDNPRLLITTTPKRVRLLRDLLADGDNEAVTGVHVTRGRTAENIHYARRQREALERKYAGTSMLRQELEGELLAEVDGCLFPLEKFNETRVFPGQDHLPQWRRVVVGYDPATTSSARSDESGIVVMAEGNDGDYYCLEDCSGRFTPEQAMKVIAEAVYRNAADCVVAEVNVAGDFIRSLLATVDPDIAIRPVQGMKGKIARAQGPSSLFNQGRVHMVGDTFAKLEEQLSAMTLEDDRSRMHDDRADAAIWCLIHLAGGNQGDWGAVYGFRDCPGCGARVNFEKDAVCGHCGKPVTKPVPKAAGGRPAKEPWSIAYQSTCTNEDCGKKYPPREPTCPHCSMNPAQYMAKALAMSAGQAGGWHSYTGRDLFAGRRF